MVLTFIILNYTTVYAQKNGFIDTVYSFNPGSGQNTGQSPEYFPLNIFGPPSQNASNSIPESNPSEILSLGFGGEIVVGFKNSYIYDGDGIDFIIFENAFVNPINKKIFAEPANVSVSEDGINYISFPFDSLTLEGCAGTKPTIGNQDPFDYNVSGGNGFDLSILGLKKAKYIKIRDISHFILENEKHPFYDPTISGFDLDAVAGIYVFDETNYINDFFNSQNKYEKLIIYNYLGSKIASYEHQSINEVKNLLESGCYLIETYSSYNIQLTKICVD